MIGRRQLMALMLAGGSVLAGTGPLRFPRAEERTDGPRLNDDGLYVEPWFLHSFLDLAEDLQMAADKGKRFAVMWELKGCPYCKETHLVNFANPTIRTYVRENFEILQLNLVGSREVTDFDGEALEERELARKWGVKFTPTTQFFPETLDAVAGRPGDEAEVTRMPGYFRPPHFLAMYRYVNEKAYETMDFRTYLETLPEG